MYRKGELVKMSIRDVGTRVAVMSGPHLLQDKGRTGQIVSVSRAKYP